MNLVIAEKPSVAQSIAKVIGATTKHDGYLEGSGYLVSWCVGHLVELAEPEEYDGKYEKWRKEDLPIIPGKDRMDWRYQVSMATKKQFNILKELMKREDVDCTTNACDAGREGELIFRLVYDKVGCKKPIKRLWISSMEDEAIGIIDTMKDLMVNFVGAIAFSIIGYFYEARHKTKSLAKELMIEPLEEEIIKKYEDDIEKQLIDKMR